MNFPQPHLKNWRVGIRTKLCRVPEPFLCLSTRLFSTPLSVEAAWKQCRRRGPLSPGQAVELGEPSSLFTRVPFFPFYLSISLSSSGQSIICLFLLCGTRKLTSITVCCGPAKTSPMLCATQDRVGPLKGLTALLWEVGREGSLRNSRDSAVKTIGDPAVGRLQSRFYSQQLSKSTSLGVDCFFFIKRVGEERSDRRWVLKIPIIYTSNIISFQLSSWLLSALGRSGGKGGPSSFPCSIQETPCPPHSLSIPMLYRSQSTQSH